MAKDGRDYWLVPPELYQQLDGEFHFDFDPCPFPRAEWDGLSIPWGRSNFVNPPFLKKDGGISAWLRKAMMEYQRGNTVVLLLPCHKTMSEVLSTAEIRNLGRVKWGATDGSGKSKSMDHTLAAILRPRTVA